MRTWNTPEQVVARSGRSEVDGYAELAASAGSRLRSAEEWVRGRGVPGPSCCASRPPSLPPLPRRRGLLTPPPRPRPAHPASSADSPEPPDSAPSAWRPAVATPTPFSSPPPPPPRYNNWRRVKAELASKRRRNVVAVAAWVLDDDVAAALLSPGGGAATAPDEEAWDVAV